MGKKKAYLHGTVGAENYFGDVTNWDFNNPFDEDARTTPSQQVTQREKFPFSCRNAPNNISCKDPQINVGKDPSYLPYLANLAKWFYGEPEITIGDPDPILKHSYSVGNYNEIKRDWGMDTLEWKEQMGGRYDGKTRYHQENTGYEDWWHEYPVNDLSQTWLRYNKGDEKIQKFLLERWLSDQEANWPGTDSGNQQFGLAEGPAFPVEYELPKVNLPALIRDASLKDIVGNLKKIAELVHDLPQRTIDYYISLGAQQFYEKFVTAFLYYLSGQLKPVKSIYSDAENDWEYEIYIPKKLIKVEPFKKVQPNEPFGILKFQIEVHFKDQIYQKEQEIYFIYDGNKTQLFNYSSANQHGLQGMLQIQLFWGEPFKLIKGEIDQGFLEIIEESAVFPIIDHLDNYFGNIAEEKGSEDILFKFAKRELYDSDKNAIYYINFKIPILDMKKD